MNRLMGHRYRAMGRLCGILLGMAALGSGLTRAAAPQAVWELTPYRVRVVLSLQRTAELTPGLEADLRTGLTNQVDRLIGAPWQMSLAAAPPSLYEQMIADLPSVALEALPPEWLEDDKVVLMTVQLDLEGYQVAGRELDLRTQHWSPVIRATAYHPARLSDTLFWVLHRAFSPLAQIEGQNEQNAWILRLRAADLPPRDQTCMVTSPGDVFLPVTRYNDRDGKARKVTPAPWSFFIVQEIGKAALTCKLHTGIRNPLSAQRRGRVEQLALAVRPPIGPTRLVLRSRTDKNKVLAGYEVYRQVGDSKNTEFLGRSDRRGAVLLEPGNDATLRLLVIKNGGEVLARLPMVVGLEPEIVAPISDDDQRLEAEGFLAGFQESLVDLVTQRQLLQKQILTSIEAKDLDRAQSLLTALRQLKGRDECTNDLARAKQKIFSKDTVVQRKIDKLFADTQALLQQHLDAASVEQLSSELHDARQGKPPSKTSERASRPPRAANGAKGTPTTPTPPAPSNSPAAKSG